MQAYLETAEHPHATGIGASIWDDDANIFPGETDARIFRDFAFLPGADVVWIQNGYTYHTRNDDLAELWGHRAAYRRYGQNMLNLVTKIAERMGGAVRWARGAVVGAGGTAGGTPVPLGEGGVDGGGAQAVVEQDEEERKNRGAGGAGVAKRNYGNTTKRAGTSSEEHLPDVLQNPFVPQDDVDHRLFTNSATHLVFLDFLSTVVLQYDATLAPLLHATAICLALTTVLFGFGYRGERVNAAFFWWPLRFAATFLFGAMLGLPMWVSKFMPTAERMVRRGILGAPEKVDTFSVDISMCWFPNQWLVVALFVLPNLAAGRWIWGGRRFEDEEDLDDNLLLANGAPVGPRGGRTDDDDRNAAQKFSINENNVEKTDSSPQMNRTNHDPHHSSSTIFWRFLPNPGTSDADESSAATVLWVSLLLILVTPTQGGALLFTAIIGLSLKRLLFPPLSSLPLLPFTSQDFYPLFTPPPHHARG